LSKRLIVMLATATIASIAAGCGGDTTDDNARGGASLTKAEFIEQGDAICKEGNEQIADGVEDFAKEKDFGTGNPSKAEQEEVILAVVVPSLKTQANELGDLGAPDGEEREVAAIVDALKAGIEELEDDPASLSKSGGGPLSEANELAGELGFKECGR
jgi:hypothetical protein